MILLMLLAVLMTATEPIQKQQNPAGVLLAVFHQEPTAGTLAAVHTIKFDALQAFLSALCDRRGNLSLLMLQAQFTPLEHVTGAYITTVSTQAEKQRQPIRTAETATRPGSAEKIISIFRHQIPLFWRQKPLGCVSFFKKFKIPIILDRGDF